MHLTHAIRAKFLRFPRISPFVVLPLLAALVIASPGAEPVHAGLFQSSNSGPNAVDGQELQSVLSYYNATTSTAGTLASGNYHVLQSTMSVGYFTVTTGGTAGGQVVGHTAGNNVQSTSATTATNASTTGTTSGPPAYFPVTGVDYYLEVTNPTQSPLTQAWGSAVLVNTSASGTAAGLRVYKVRHILTNPDSVTMPSGYQEGASVGTLLVNLAANGNISSGGMTAVETGVTWTESWAVLNGQTQGNAPFSRSVGSTVTQVLQSFNISKLTAYDAAIDTRITYGVPNDAGVIAGADPNSPAAPIKFGSYTEYGGLFVGNAPWQDNDGSGHARVQFWPQSVSGLSPNCYSTFTAFYLGTTTAYNGNMTIGLYTPSSGDPNIGQTESTLSWPYRWAMPFDSPSGGSLLASIPFTSSSNMNDYYNFHLGVNQSVANMSYLCMANISESSFVSNQTQAWRYFASREYQGTLINPAFPFTDCNPRLWVVTLNGASSTWNTTHFTPS